MQLASMTAPRPRDDQTPTLNGVEIPRLADKTDSIPNVPISW